MRILCAGINHKTAPLELREKLAFDAQAAAAALETLRDRYTQAGFAILSTCNRSEIYLARPLHGRPREEEVRALFGEFHALPTAEYDDRLYVLVDAEAVRHLFSVAAGLDSLVPGEDQILAQVKEAQRLAESLSADGAALRELFQQALFVGKEARRSTRIADGKVSVASVAIDCARQALGDLAGKTVLSVGAGKMNVLMLRGLARLGAARMMVANRSPRRAAELAAQCNGQVVPFEAIPSALAEADVTVCSTAADRPVITADLARKALAGRNGRAMLIIDIAVPRDVEGAVGELPGVTLYNIDDLKTVVEKNVSLRSAEVDACRRLVDRKVDEYFHRRHVREVAPTIEELYKRMRDAADEELDAVSARLTGDAEADRQLVRRAIHRALRRILHTAVTRLRAAAGSEAARQHAAMLRKLFDLDGDSNP